MTKISNNSQKSNIPYNKWCVDSFKLTVDADVFKPNSVNIPDNQILVDGDTGEEICHFKKKSIPIEYKGQKIYIGRYTKILRGIPYNKVVILFSSNVNGTEYFNGITKDTVYKVLKHLQKIGRIDFNDINEVYKEIIATDIDIKRDTLFTMSDREKIVESTRLLKRYFNGNTDNIRVYNSVSEGLGLQCNWRDNSSYTRPFIKFYDKTTEIQKRHPELLQCQEETIRKEIRSNIVYRYEYTIRNNDYCKKFGISNRLQDILDLGQDKLAEIGKYMYGVNFGLIPKRSKQTNKLTFTDRMLATYMFKDIQEHGKSVYEVREMYIHNSDKVNSHQDRAKKKFEQIYSYITDEYSKEIHDDIEYLNKWINMLGIR